MIQLEPGYAISYSLFIKELITHSPDIKLFTECILFLILLLSSALMSASEVAFFSLSAEDKENFKTTDTKRARTVLNLSNKPGRLLNTILITANTLDVLIILLATFLCTAIFDITDLPLTGILIEAFVIIFLLVVPCELIAKAFAAKNNASLALFMATPLALLDKILRPFTSLLLNSASAVKKRVGPTRLNIRMDELSGTNKPPPGDMNEDGKILKGIVNFGNIDVSAIMCPRIDVTAVDIRSGFNQVLPVIINSGYSRIPVYSESFDNVKGILYAKDVLPYMNNTGNFKWQSLLRNPYFVPETKKINDLLKEFQVKKIHMAVVIDEYGGTSGIITLEDILEEIVGEITDESDSDEVLYRKIDNKTYIFEGKILLNDLIKLLDLETDPFEDVRGESETLAGLILELTGEIPQQDQIIKYGHFTFTIESADKRRIKEIRVEISADDDKTEKV